MFGDKSRANSRLNGLYEKATMNVKIAIKITTARFKAYASITGSNVLHAFFYKEPTSRPSSKSSLFVDLK